ncbi:MAG: HAMP domain-containing protein [Spirochaetaceae bacterium]|jgi:signal transduction histidine kinase|nr:HAMP domain-containing protein [Spirochaetaceae bacterium]
MNFTISLKNRLALTYALFIAAALGILTLAVNMVTGHIFNTLVRDNIAGKSKEIVRDIGDWYNPMSGGFDAVSIETMGMYFVHEGYILTVEDAAGNLVWDARSCDMEQCMEVINSITRRMEGRFFLNGALRKEQYPVSYAGGIVGTVTIETYGPFFYSETETKFLGSLNRLLLIAGILLTLISAGISVLLSRAIARPVNKAGEAARQIARAHAPQTARAARAESSGGVRADRLAIRIPDQYKTRELAELSRSINELAAELEEAELRQRRLTADIAHELRTPLACLQGGLEAMMDGVYTPDREHLESCHEEILRLAGLVDDLNTLAALEGGAAAPGTCVPYGALVPGPADRLHKTEFDLAKLLRGTAEQFRAAAAEKGIAITLNLRESPVTADYDRLKQVFINLLSNAVKYTDRGGITISIQEGGERFPGARWEASVADTGIGIPERDLSHIFERFYRSDKSRSRSTGGAGIGLTIAAAIVHAHGGIISAENGASAGAVFRVAL